MAAQVADLIEQISTVSTYGDIYHELSPGVLWPGTGLPGMGFAFYSRMLKSAAPYLPNVPPVFNGENSRLRTAFLAGLHFHTELAVLQGMIDLPLPTRGGERALGSYVGWTPAGGMRGAGGGVGRGTPFQRPGWAAPE